MTPKQYLAALKKLELTVAGKGVTERLGVNVRQSQRYAAGTSKIPRTLELLIAVLLDQRR